MVEVSKTRNRSSCLDTALELVERGISVIPLYPKGKKTFLPSWSEYQERLATEDEIESWFEEYPDANIAIVTGKISDIYAVDADGPEGKKWVTDNLPKTSVYQVTGRGFHALYRSNGKPVPNAAGICTGVDIRGDGGYVVAAPSIHPSGKPYELKFLEGFDGWDDLAEFPSDAFKTIKREKSKLSIEPVEEGERNNQIARLAGRYIGKGLSFDEVLFSCLGYNQTLSKPLSKKEVEATVSSIWQKDTSSGISEKNLKVINSVSAVDFLQLEFPPRTNILSPWLPSQGITLLHAFRGVGKTHVSIGVAVAVSTASTFLQWKAEKAHGVLFLDGEMPAAVLQERLVQAIAASDGSGRASLNIVTPDLQEMGMPDLSTIEGQQQIEPLIGEDIKLIVVDNISTICRTTAENKGDDWMPVQEWALRMRAKGKSILLIHHEGKGGQQRGTSRREDILDTVIQLKHPANYSPEQGACFEVHFRKARGIYGDDVKPFEAQLNIIEGIPVWTTRTVEESTYQKVVDLLNEGWKQTDIATELGVVNSAVTKHKKRAVANGDFKPKG